jgi:hypothetical protein
VNLRAAFIFLALGIISLLITMGALSAVRWLRIAYPKQFRSILVALCLALVCLGVWGYMEANDRPAFHEGDLLTLQEPIVARMRSSDRNSPTASCIIDIYEHVAVIETQTGTLTGRVESNNMSGPSFCGIGAEIQVELRWLHRYTLTHRHS